MFKDFQQEPTDFQQRAKQEEQKSRFETVVLEGLLYLASDRGANSLPSIEDYLISEIVAGACEYVTGEFQEGHSECEGFRRDPWISRINRNLENLCSQTKFNPALADAIKSWAYVRWCHDHGESWWESQIRYWLMFGNNNRMQSTFAFTVPQARKIEESLKTLDSDTLRHMENIAEIMKRYIRQDLEYIREHYGW